MAAMEQEAVVMEQESGARAAVGTVMVVVGTAQEATLQVVAKTQPINLFADDFLEKKLVRPTTHPACHHPVLPR